MEEKTPEISGTMSPPPPGGWLALACFQVQWSKKCTALMKQVQDLISSWPWIRFLSIKADAKGMAKIANSYKVTSFPSFVFLRNGEPLNTFPSLAGETKLFLRYLTMIDLLKQELRTCLKSLYINGLLSYTTFGI